MTPLTIAAMNSRQHRSESIRRTATTVRDSLIHSVCYQVPT